MDFSELDEVLALRAEIREFLSRALTPEVRTRGGAGGHEGFFDWEFHRALADAGWIGLDVPQEYGGRGLGPLAASVLAEELIKAGASASGLTTSMMIAHTLVHCGSEWQRREFLPRILRGEVIIALGYTEPGAGSDLASVSSRSTQEDPGERWLVNAQKMFTTSAHMATHVFLLTRSGPPGRGHRGLTLFLVPLSSPGIEITPIYTLGGERTNATYYTDVLVDDEMRVGAPGEAWGVLMVALSFERRARFVNESRQVLASLAQRLSSEPPLPERERGAYDRLLVDTAIDIEVSVALDQAAKWVYAQGEIPRIEGSMARLHSTLAYQRATSRALEALGPQALVPKATSSSFALEEALRQSVIGTIYGGSSEVQRNIIAQGHLRMPRN
jgi:alkylation response protein AidB-like acyl-CoA dehydrogenase